MDDEVNEIRSRKSYRWVRSDSGTTYLCPEEAWEWGGGAPDSLLSSVCVDESSNPHND